MLLTAALFAVSLVGSEGPSVVVAIQPLGPFPRKAISSIKQGILGQYDVKIVVLKPLPLPKSAYYAPRNRYRAPALLSYLQRRPGSYDRVLGLTTKDISTPARGQKDWGIFGQAQEGGRACVASTFRLGRRPGIKSATERLIEVVNHELGHTFGLPHCLNPRCLMADAEGSIKTFDRSTGRLCASCRLKARPASAVR